MHQDLLISCFSKAINAKLHLNYRDQTNWLLVPKLSAAFQIGIVTLQSLVFIRSHLYRECFSQSKK